MNYEGVKEFRVYSRRGVHWLVAVNHHGGFFIIFDMYWVFNSLDEATRYFYGDSLNAYPREDIVSIYEPDKEQGWKLEEVFENA